MSEHCKRWAMSNPIWMIHKIWAGGSSARALFFTREQGLVWAKYHGGWGPKKQAMLQSFTPLWIEFTQRQTWYYVRHLEIAGSAFEFTAPHLFSALYINELLYHMLRPQDPQPDLYDAYVTTLQQVSLADTKLDLEQVLRRFEWTVLVSTGYAMSLTVDQSGTPIVATQYYNFQPGNGFSVASTGILGTDILSLANDELTDPKILKTAKYIMRRALEHALGGKKLKSRDFFKSAQTAMRRAEEV